MPRRGLLSLLIFSLIVMAGCGKKGPIEPPLARVPQAVENLALIQRGSAFLLTWTNPSSYVDGNPLVEVTEVEIWMLKEDRGAGGAAKHWTAETFGSHAELLARISQDRMASFRRIGAKTDAELSYAYAIPADDFGKKIITFSLRVRDLKKRASGFAEPVFLEAMAPPGPPREVKTKVSEDHIQISWGSAEQTATRGTAPKVAGYNIYRSDGEGLPSRLNSEPLKTNEFRDKDFLFGRTYRYFVRAVLDSKSPVESDDSEVVESVAKDIFAPAPPSGLTAIGGPGFIALNWEGGRESDLAGYRVWRRMAGQKDFVLVASLAETDSSFSDSKVEKGKRYEYAITALDTAGNESQKSALVFSTVRDESP